MASNQTSNQNPLDYLEKTGISNTLKEIVNSILEHRPYNPLHFISRYLKTSSSTGLMKPYRLIKQCPLEHEAFMSNLTEAYMQIDSKKGGGDQGLTGKEYMKLVNMLCVDFPSEVVEEVLAVVGKRENEVLGFQEFRAGISTVIMFEEFFEEAEEIFRLLDKDSEGSVETQLLLKSLEKLQDYELTMPSAEELRTVLNTLNLENKTRVSFGEFCLAIFRRAF